MRGKRNVKCIWPVILKLYPAQARSKQYTKYCQTTYKNDRKLKWLLQFLLVPRKNLN